MATGKSGKRSSIAELGPAWITAIATLLAALVAVAGFFVVRAAEPATSDPSSSSSAAVAARASSTDARPPASPPTSPGTMLSRFTVDLPGEYGITFGIDTPRPVPVDSGTDLFLSLNSGIYTSDHAGTLVTVDAGTPGYADCIGSTRFTSSVIFPKPGSGFCYQGHDLVVAIAVIKSLPSYDTLAVTVWKAPSR